MSRPASHRRKGLVSRRRYVVVGTIFAAVAVAMLYLAFQTPMYRATAEMVVDLRSPVEQLLGSAPDGSEVPERSLATEARLVDSFEVRNLVFDEFPEARMAKVTTTADSSNDTLSIHVESDDPELAADVANAFAQAVKDRQAEQAAEVLTYASSVIERQLAEIAAAESEPELGEADRAAYEQQRQGLLEDRRALQLGGDLVAAGSIQVVEPATTPEDPFSPQFARILGWAVVLGIGLGGFAALFVDRLDRSITSADDLEPLVAPAPVVSVVPRVRDWRDRFAARVISLEDPGGESAEAYRVLRAALQTGAVERGRSVIQITSAAQGEGKTTTAVNLAVAFCNAGKQVILVDADLRTPRVYSFFDIPAAPGLTSVIVNNADIAKTATVVQEDVGMLAVLPCGPLPPGPAELLSSEQMRQVLNTLREVADVVVVDSSSIVGVSDALALSSYVDATVLVASAEQGRSDQTKRAAGLLVSVGANLVGSVLNEASESSVAAARGGRNNRPERAAKKRSDSNVPAMYADAGPVAVDEGVFAAPPPSFAPPSSDPPFSAPPPYPAPTGPRHLHDPVGSTEVAPVWDLHDLPKKA